jgi:hypothetical protein
MAVVQPVYHSFEGKGGQGSFFASGKRRLSCERVFRRSKGYVIEISTAPAVEPAMIERRALGCFPSQLAV